MSFWTRDHRALLGALRATSIVPALVRRLSLERVAPDDAEIRRLRGWAASLQADAGWKVLAPVIDAPDAWPLAWDDAVAAGFAPETDHHHALLFGRFADRYIDARDWEAADWTWRQAIDAWGRVFATDYAGRVFDDVAPKLSDQGPGREEMLRTMLDDVLGRCITELREASNIHNAKARDVEKRRLRFAWRALEHASSLLQATSDPFGTLARVAALAAEARAGVGSQILVQFERRVAELDLSTVAGEELLGPFEWVGAFCEIAGYSESFVTTMISTIVDTCWGLRRVGRDEIKEFAALLDLGEPFNVDLYRRLVAMDSAFGHNARCADFLVFVGEKQSGIPRRTTFERGLEVCPGHRNSAMLLSYEMIREATQILTQIAVMPALAARIPGNRAEEQLRKVKAILDEVEATYPYNESLPDAQNTLAKELGRLNVEL